MRETKNGVLAPVSISCLLQERAPRGGRKKEALEPSGERTSILRSTLLGSGALPPAWKGIHRFAKTGGATNIFIFLLVS